MQRMYVISEKGADHHENRSRGTRRRSCKSVCALQGRRAAQGEAQVALHRLAGTDLSAQLVHQAMSGLRTRALFFCCNEIAIGSLKNATRILLPYPCSPLR